MNKDYFKWKGLKIDSEGFCVSDGLRLVDEDFGSEVLKNIEMDPHGRAFTFYKDEPIRIEAFDQPLVIQMVYKEGEDLVLEAPYHTRFRADLKSLSLDFWDRFHGLTEKEQPFVFSRKAQNEFFDLADEFGDDWISWNGQVHETPNYYQNNPPAETSDFWQDRYSSKDTPWDLGEPAPGISSALKTLKLSKQRIAVLGCGTGEDAAFLAKQGHLVTAFDFSAESLRLAQERHGSTPQLKFVLGDFFELPSKFRDAFDMVFEHTCFAAISPGRREELVRVWRSLLTPSGAVLGIFLLHNSRSGPPFGLTEWELQQHFGAGFEHLYWSRLDNSPEERLELLVYSQLKKKD